MKNLLTAVTLLASLAAPAARAAAAQTLPEVYGHRGARAVSPENTLAGFREAIRAGARAIEFDLNVTKDGALLIAHDQAVDPVICLGPGGKALAKGPAIRELTLKEAQAFDCGALANPKFPRQKPSPGERMPTVEELFSMVLTSTEPAAGSLEFDVEAKSVPGSPGLAPAPEDFARLIVDAIDRFKLEERCIVKSFDQRVILAVKKLKPGIRTSLLTSDNNLDFVAAVRGAKADILSPDSLWITPEQVAELHGAGIKVMPWTVNDPREWQRMVDYRVDAIITDDPAGLAAFLKGADQRPGR